MNFKLYLRILIVFAIISAQTAPAEGLPPRLITMCTLTLNKALSYVQQLQNLKDKSESHENESTQEDDELQTKPWMLAVQDIQTKFEDLLKKHGDSGVLGPFESEDSQNSFVTPLPSTMQARDEFTRSYEDFQNMIHYLDERPEGTQTVVREIRGREQIVEFLDLLISSQPELSRNVEMQLRILELQSKNHFDRYLIRNYTAKKSKAATLAFLSALSYSALTLYQEHLVFGLEIMVISMAALTVKKYRNYIRSGFNLLSPLGDSAEREMQEIEASLYYRGERLMRFFKQVRELAEKEDLSSEDFAFYSMSRKVGSGTVEYLMSQTPGNDLTVSEIGSEEANTILKEEPSENSLDKSEIAFSMAFIKDDYSEDNEPSLVIFARLSDEPLSRKPPKKDPEEERNQQGQESWGSGGFIPQGVLVPAPANAPKRGR